jgi:hypothetical protein
MGANKKKLLQEVTSMRDVGGYGSADFANSTVVTLLKCFQKVRKSGAGWTARCPAHDDKENPLSVAVGLDGTVLLNWFAGCATDVILEKIGLAMRHLFTRDDSGIRAPRKQKRRFQNWHAKKNSPGLSPPKKDSQ